MQAAGRDSAARKGRGATSRSKELDAWCGAPMTSIRPGARATTSSESQENSSAAARSSSDAGAPRFSRASSSRNAVVSSRDRHASEPEAVMPNAAAMTGALKRYGRGAALTDGPYRIDVRAHRALPSFSCWTQWVTPRGLLRPAEGGGRGASEPCCSQPCRSRRLRLRAAARASPLLDARSCGATGVRCGATRAQRRRE